MMHATTLKTLCYMKRARDKDQSHMNLLIRGSWNSQNRKVEQQLPVAEVRGMGRYLVQKFHLV